jgi:2-polyprenyl-3-methyl-5-hydroxy-6-metoxy-1,4-benzoquinol methylase
MAPTSQSKDKIQSGYFDKSQHRYPLEYLIAPPLAQELELENLSSFLSSPIKQLADFGSGNGRTSLFFLSRGVDVFAVDISVKSLSQLKAVYTQKHCSSWGRLTISSVLPSHPQFNAVVGTDILHHVDIPSQLGRIFTSLKSGGQVVFSEPNPLHPLWYLYYFIHHVPWKLESGILQATSRSLRYSFARAGFDHILISGHGLLPTGIFNFWPRLCRFNALVLGNTLVTRPLAFRYIISARKPKFAKI